MEAEDVIKLTASSVSGFEDENNEIKDFDCGPGEADFRPNISDNIEDDSKSESMEISGGNDENEYSQSVEQKEQDKDFVNDSSIVQVKVELTKTVELAETVIASDQMNSSNSTVHARHGFLDVQDGCPIYNHVIDVSSISGVKRARMTVDEQQPSVHVIYNSITRASRQKLEELLQQWSEWQAQRGSSPNHEMVDKACGSDYGGLVVLEAITVIVEDPNEVTESGEETYFPAIHVGSEMGSSVSFWIDNQTRNQQNKGSIPLDSSTVPLYDRGYALGLTSGDGSSNLEGGLEIIDDASRCFNCGSYSHSLKECPKPRDNVAVNTARKLLKSKRNLNSASRNPTRYYQSSVGGKYDGLRPGALGAETRQLLGLGVCKLRFRLSLLEYTCNGKAVPSLPMFSSGVLSVSAGDKGVSAGGRGPVRGLSVLGAELDPPPWLYRMRELGYPPGYLEPDNEDQPSGITIYADGEVKEEQEDGEIIETDAPEPQRKMTVEFPGINAPIPENADERLWAAGPSNSNPYRDRSHHRSNHYSESISRGYHREQRWSRDYRDDGPPGCDPVFSPSTSSYHSRYAFNYSPHSSSSAFGRSESDRHRRSPLLYEDYATHGSYSSSYGASSFEHEVDRYRDDYSLDHSSRSVDEYDRHRHRSSRW
ncbi:hypothetical protein JRO89_XS12G0197500 [Xanthoceras sorbifolium]|uniref:CCHC-type domain-containing protein n=1 Tax=Xanthoceras sorbifolium TaxID=99658 RepID=A0ABQ8HD64_9ROSI|nr:hypothetical protein JRO89_XS12G0197500 [Xanthoceras sorbifolium]